MPDNGNNEQGAGQQEQEFLDGNYPPQPPEGTPPPEAPPAAPPPETPPEEPATPPVVGLPKDQVTKYPGSEIGQILIVPAGYDVEHPLEQASMEKVAKMQDELTSSEKRVEELEKELEGKDEEIKGLNEKLQEIADTKRNEMAGKIADMRIEKGLLSADDKEEEVKKLSQLPFTQLNVALEDTKALTEKAEPNPKTLESGVQQTEDEAAKAKARLEMFGSEKHLSEIEKEEAGEIDD